MPEQVDIRVSPAFHPETFTALDGYNEDSAKFIGDAVSAFNAAYHVLGKIHDATDVGKRNGAWAEEQRILAVGKMARTEQDKLCRKFTVARDSIAKAADFIDGQLTVPLKEKANLGNLNQEVRGHCKALDRTDRTALLNEAFEASDTETLQAILGAQPFLSGLSPPEHAHYLRRFHEQQNPEMVGRLTLMRSVLDKLDRDAPLLFKEVDRAVGADPLKVRGIDAANDAALAAVKIEPVA